jgi:hypothetical protein
VEAFADTHLAIERYLCRHTLAQARAWREEAALEPTPPVDKRVPVAETVRRASR